jgi:hypothetical protein
VVGRTVSEVGQRPILPYHGDATSIYVSNYLLRVRVFLSYLTVLFFHRLLLWIKLLRIKNMFFVRVTYDIITVYYCIFRRVDRKFINYLPTFINRIESLCRTDLGSAEPLEHLAHYSVDDKFAAIDLDTNTTRIELDSLFLFIHLYNLL